MARPTQRNTKAIESLIRLAIRHPRTALIVAAITIVVLIVLSQSWRFTKKPPPVTGDGKPATVLLCAWNVENFYDDRDDLNINDDMEDWFGNDAAAYRAKVDHLAEAILKMNDGIGPDIACLCEVENDRCLESLKDALNAKLDAAGLGDRKYTTILFKGDNTGRHFAPAILTRLGVTGDRTRKLGTRYNGRILEGHLHHNGHELIVIAAHWTSRVSDDKDDGRRRLSYANDCYGRIKAILKENADADIVLCGDFNDEFHDVSMQTGLRACKNADEVRNAIDEPKLFAPLADWTGQPPGTIRHERKWYIFDHICVTRGILDNRAWSSDAKTASVFGPDPLRRNFRDGNYEPFKFGNKNWKGDRGYSDHFPVTIQLSVAGAEAGK